jgi:hypothetical protein
MISVQVIQSTGRGVRRDTHQGLETAAEAMREVRTHIYVAGFGDSVRQQQQQQIAEKQGERKALAGQWRDQQDLLADYIAEEAEINKWPASKAKTKQLSEAKKRTHLTKKNVAALVSKMQELNDDVEMLNGGKVFVGTGVQNKKTGEEKQKLVPIWNILPDQVVYNSTKADEQSKEQVEEVVKVVSVHAVLLKEFHKDVKILQASKDRSDVGKAGFAGNRDIPTLMSMMQLETDTSARQTARIEMKAKPDTAQGAFKLPAESKPGATLAPGDDVNLDRQAAKQSCIGCYQPSELGLQCSSGHFVCTGCVSMLILLDLNDLEKLQRHEGILRCPSTAGTCEPFCADRVESMLRRASHSAYEEYRNLRRKAHKVKPLVSGAGIPARWTGMEQDKYKVKMVELTKGAPDGEYEMVERSFRKTCKHQHIVRIERIQNLEQWRLYDEKKKAMVDKNPDSGCNERDLFHGTHATAVPLINTKSFNRSYCGRNATAYGQGVYFARDASYSASDTYSPPDDEGVKHMYRAKVLAGMTTLGDSSMLEPPPRPDGRGDYDSTCNDSRRGDAGVGPAITVVYHDAQAYAEYLIRFR